MKDYLPTEDIIHRPGGIDDEIEMEEYICAYLTEEYGYCVKSFTFDFDMTKIYINNIIWDEED